MDHKSSVSLCKRVGGWHELYLYTAVVLVCHTHEHRLDRTLSMLQVNHVAILDKMKERLGERMISYKACNILAPVHHALTGYTRQPTGQNPSHTHSPFV